MSFNDMVADKSASIYELRQLTHGNSMAAETWRTNSAVNRPIAHVVDNGILGEGAGSTYRCVSY